MLTGLAWALREMKGPAATPAAPAAANFRKSRRVAFGLEGCAMDIPLMWDVDRFTLRDDDTAPRRLPRQGPRGRPRRGVWDPSYGRRSATWMTAVGAARGVGVGRGTRGKR